MSGVKVNTADDIFAFADIDREFGSFLLRKSGVKSRELQLAGMLLMLELRSGNPQLDLKNYAGKEFKNENGSVELFPDAVLWQNSLLDTRLSHVVSTAWRNDSTALLVMTGHCTVMLNRYAGFEESVKQNLLSRRCYTSCFDDDFVRSNDQIQDLALFMALNSGLLILSGGPGTGKTTLCGRIISEILLRNPEKRILLSAPTGKAQQRLSSQIRESAGLLPDDSAAQQAMRSVSGTTLHRFLCNRLWRNQLEFCDLLVLDECSMISLEMFSAILKLLPAKASLILVGDRRQLPSVDSGSIFSDICNFGVSNLLPEAAADSFSGVDIPRVTSEMPDDFSGYIVELKTNYRSEKAPSICNLAKLMCEDGVDTDFVVDKIVNTDSDDYHFCTKNQNEIIRAVKSKCAMLESLPLLCSSGNPALIEEALEKMEKFRFLCAVNRGECGTVAVNRIILETLGILTDDVAGWKPGTVLLIRENDARTGLCNGDSGIVTLETTDDGQGMQLYVRFPAYRDRRFLLSELPQHECGFAISVHKAQGSGYNDVVLILPGYNSMVLDKKLFYTGITRAAEHIEVWGSEAEIRFALTNNKTRASNLFQRT